MAREESQRENLLREATALVERIELAPLPDSDVAAQHVVAGFRRDGGLSIFFGEDPVYQFNASGELRRAYCDGKLIKAVGGRLASLNRVRTEGEVQLVRHDLSEPEQDALVQRMASDIRGLAAIVAGNEYEIVGQSPPNFDVLVRLRNWLDSHQEWPIALRPNV